MAQVHSNFCDTSYSAGHADSGAAHNNSGHGDSGIYPSHNDSPHSDSRTPHGDSGHGDTCASEIENWPGCTWANAIGECGSYHIDQSACYHHVAFADNNFYNYTPFVDCSPYGHTAFARCSPYSYTAFGDWTNHLDTGHNNSGGCYHVNERVFGDSSYTDSGTTPCTHCYQYPGFMDCNNGTPHTDKAGYNFTQSPYAHQPFVDCIPYHDTPFADCSPYHHTWFVNSDGYNHTQHVDSHAYTDLYSGAC